MFPVGSLYKCQIRRIAMEAGLLEVADKPEVDFEVSDAIYWRYVYWKIEMLRVLRWIHVLLVWIPYFIL